jgi:hypothetical protein
MEHEHFTRVNEYSAINEDFMFCGNGLGEPVSYPSDSGWSYAASSRTPTPSVSDSEILRKIRLMIEDRRASRHNAREDHDYDFFMRMIDVTAKTSQFLKSRIDLGVWREFNKWWNRGYVREDSVSVRGALGGLDDHLDELPSDLTGCALNPRNIPRMAGKIAARVRIELVVERRDQATLIVVKEFIVRYLKSINMRHVDIATILPYAVQLSFIPTKHEILARNMTLQESYQHRLEQHSVRKYTRGRRWLFNWFGSVIQEPQVEHS